MFETPSSLVVDVKSDRADIANESSGDNTTRESQSNKRARLKCSKRQRRYLHLTRPVLLNVCDAKRADGDEADADDEGDEDEQGARIVVLLQRNIYADCRGN
jgi:hypothetical protein